MRSWARSSALLALCASGWGCGLVLDARARAPDAAVGLDTPPPDAREHPDDAATTNAVDAEVPGPHDAVVTGAADAFALDAPILTGPRDSGRDSSPTFASDARPVDARLDAFRRRPVGFADPCEPGMRCPAGTECGTAWDGAFCYYSACTAACDVVEQCQTWLVELGLDPSAVTCDFGVCNLGRTVGPDGGIIGREMCE